MLSPALLTVVLLELGVTTLQLIKAFLDLRAIQNYGFSFFHDTILTAKSDPSKYGAKVRLYLRLFLFGK